MAVLERSYKRYQGALSPEWSRFLIIPRHAFRDVFRSKLFTGFYFLSFIWPLVCAILIYLRHNTEALAILKLSIANVLPIDAVFFRTFLQVQGAIGFFLAMLVGPQQVSKDLTNNALVIPYTTLGALANTIRQELSDGRLTTSLNSGGHALGYADNALLGHAYPR